MERVELKPTRVVAGATRLTLLRLGLLIQVLSAEATEIGINVEATTAIVMKSGLSVLRMSDTYRLSARTHLFINVDLVYAPECT